MERPVLPSIHHIIRDQRPNEGASLTLAPLQISTSDHVSRPRHAYHDQQRHVPRSLSEPSSKGPHGALPHYSTPQSLPHSRQPSQSLHSPASPSDYTYSHNVPYSHHHAMPTDRYPTVPSHAPRSRPSTSSGLSESERLDEDNGDIFSASMKYECNVCKKRFYRPSGLRIHLASHSDDKPFVCPVEGCGRSFGVLSNMRRHARLHQADSENAASLDDNHR